MDKSGSNIDSIINVYTDVIKDLDNYTKYLFSSKDDKIFNKSISRIHKIRKKLENEGINSICEDNDE